MGKKNKISQVDQAQDLDDNDLKLNICKPKKKKRHKVKEVQDNSVESQKENSNSNLENACKKKKKHKKNKSDSQEQSKSDGKNETVELCDGNGKEEMLEPVPVSQTDSVTTKKKKSKDKKVSLSQPEACDPKEVSEVTMTENDTYCVKEKKKKKKKKSKVAISSDVQETEQSYNPDNINGHEAGNINIDTVINIDMEDTRKKKKRKNIKHDENHVSENVSHEVNKGSPKQNKSKMQEYNVGDSGNLKIQREKKKSKKHSKNVRDDSQCSDLSDIEDKSKECTQPGLVSDEGNCDKRKKKKRKKKSLDETNNNETTTSDVMSEALSVEPKKKKRKHKVEQNDIEDTTMTATDNICQQKYNVKIKHSDVVQNENCGGDTINTCSDKHELQEKDQTSANVGQWSAVNLGSSDRQQKFLRLLGGFKKKNEGSGASGKLKSPISFGSGGGLAFNVEQQTAFNRKLEQQYDQALALKLNKQKGGGLGFEAPPGEGKKFHIDAQQSKSLKFSD